MALNRLVTVDWITNTSSQEVETVNNTSFPANSNSSITDVTNSPSCQRIAQVYVVFLITIVSAGILGNGLCILVLHLKAKRTNFNFLIKVLSVIDITLLLLLPVDRLLYRFQSTHLVYWVFVLYVIEKLGGIMRLASVWMLVIIAFFRYMAVCVPMKVKLYCTHRNARRCVIAVIIVDLLVHVPFFFNENVVKVENSSDAYMIDQTEWGYSNHHFIYAHVVYTGCLFFILPFITLIFFSTRMIFTLCGRQREKYFSVPHLKNEAIDVTKVVIGIIVVFMISYTPYFIWTIDSLIPGRRDKLHSSACAILFYRYTLDLLLYVNSSINFFIYFWLRRQFRLNVNELFPCTRESRARRNREDRLGRGAGTGRRVSVTVETELST